MNKYEIIQKIENFAPPETAEKWDCSGWLIETDKTEVNKILLALTVTDDIYTQALQNECDIIIAHHPLFSIPLKYKNIDIYCAHTNMDLAQGGTTDSLIDTIQANGLLIRSITKTEGFVRYIDTQVSPNELLNILSKVSNNMRYTSKTNKEYYSKIAICAGSGSEFIEEAHGNGADAYITGDLKFHTALDSPIDVYDVGHFETEIQVLKVFHNLIGKDIEVIYAKESSPFETYTANYY